MRHLSPAALIIAAASVVIASAVVPPSAASAATATARTVQAVDHAHPRPAAPAKMVPHPAAAFEAAAAALPPSLRTSIARDLHTSPAAYLAESSAAQNAVDVLDRLKKSGVTTDAAHLDGTTLVVPVATQSAADLVSATGAVPEVGPVPVVPRDSGLKGHTDSDLRGGQGWGYTTGFDGSGWRCSVGFNGHDLASGAARFVTAGHCYGSHGPALGDAFLLNQTGAGAEHTGPDLGGLASSDFRFGNNYDEGLVSPASGINPLPAVTTWNGGVGAPTTSINVTGYTSGVVGAPICKSGSRSGWTCGHILALDRVVTLDDVATVNSIVSDLCSIPGDSGGAALVGSSAVGILSGGNWDDCSKPKSPGYFTSFFPLVSSGGKESVMSAVGSSWEPSISIAKPVVTSIPSLFAGSSLTGTLANGTTRHVISVALDGSATPVTVSVAADGTWSLPLTGLAPGTHTYRIVATLGTWSTSPQTTGSFTLSVKPSVSRLAGPDRYSVAVAVSQSGFLGTANVVYVAAGTTFPDALSAAPAAAHAHAPLLLVPGTSIPKAVSDELSRLKPATIVVVGGAGAVSAGVFDKLRAFASGSVVRIGGTDRFDTSRKLAAYAFPSGASSAFIANGMNFPDAVSAGAAAGAVSAPIILVNGAKTTVDAATTSALTTLGVTTFAVAGGTGAVSAGIASQLAARPGATVTRYGGADRYQTSGLINHAYFTSGTTVYLASGLAFPDALGGAARAGTIPAALYTIPQNCVPSYVLADIQSSGATQVVVLGGTGALGTGVDALTACR